MATDAVRAAVAPLATTDTLIYTCPASKRATVDVSVCERGGGTPTYRLAHVDSTSIGDVAAADYIVFDKALAANETIRHSRIVLRAGDTLMARASDGNTSFVMWGYEGDD